MFVADVPVSYTFLTFSFLSQLREEENREGTTAPPEGSASGEGSSETGEGSDGSSSSSSSSNDGDDGEKVQEGEEDSPKVDVTN
jgi:hypothetical protein